jgi:hypothetical protein
LPIEKSEQSQSAIDNQQFHDNPHIDNRQSTIRLTSARPRGHVGRHQRWLVFLTAVAVVFDGIDNQLLASSFPR